VEPQDFKSPLPPRRISVVEEPSTVTPPAASVSKEEAPEIITTRQTLAPAKKSFIPYLIGIFVIALLALLAFKFIIPYFKNKNSQPITLTYWGLWEEVSVLQGIISEFESKNPNIKINYIKNNKTDYRSRLSGRLAKDPETEEVPDIFRIHSSWLPMFKGSISPVPSATLTALNFEQDFYPVYKKDLKIDNSYYAIPLMYDAIVLFYNKDLIQKGGVELPKTWWDLKTAASKLTVRNQNGNIEIAGVAMGLTENVDHWSDILGLLLKQNGANILKRDEENNTKIKDVLSYYINFYSDEDRPWDENQPSSTELFANGKLAFYIAPSWRVFNIDEINPQLPFEITSIPQLPIIDTGNLTNIHWATYWVEAVNSQSKHQAEAWKFLEFLASKESLEKMYTAASDIRRFGEIYPRKSLGENLKNNPKLKPFIESAESDYAESGYLSSRTFDDGLNTELSKYFGDAINSIVKNNSDPETVMTTLNSGLDQIIQKYKLE
jgi:multiple sugar transport system substrate-binding protein